MRWLDLAWVMGAAWMAAAMAGACSSDPITSLSGSGGSSTTASSTATGSSSNAVAVSVGTSSSSASSSGPAASSTSSGGVGPCWDGCEKIEMQCMLPSSCAQLMIDCNSMDPVYDCMGQCALNAQCVEILQQNSPFAMCVQGCIQGGAGGAGGGGPSPAQQCSNCMQQSCQAAIMACGSVCASWFNCVSACPDQACVQNCNAQTPQAMPVFNCGCANCGSTCGPFCGGTGGTGSTGAGGADGGP